MKKNLTKKLMLSVLTLAFAVVSLGASTFAWFTLSEKAEIKSFEGTVTGGAGLEIQVLKSEDEVQTDNWRVATISSEMIQAVVGDVVFQAATPSLTDGKFTFAENVAKFENQTEGAVGKGSFVQFDVAFRLSDQSGTTDYPLYFDGYTLNTDAESVKEWRVNKEYSGKLDAEAAHPFAVAEKVTYYVSDAARLAIQVKDNGTGVAGVTNIYESAGYTGSKTYTSGCPTTNNAAFNYYNAVNENDADAQLKVEKIADYAFNSNVGFEASGLQVGVLKGASQVRLTVLVWVEGWDGECINAIFSQKLLADLSFFLKLPTA